MGRSQAQENVRREVGAGREHPDLTRISLEIFPPNFPLSAALNRRQFEAAVEMFTKSTWIL